MYTPCSLHTLHVVYIRETQCTGPRLLPRYIVHEAQELKTTHKRTYYQHDTCVHDTVCYSFVYKREREKGRRLAPEGQRLTAGRRTSRKIVLRRQSNRERTDHPPPAVHVATTLRSPSSSSCMIPEDPLVSD